MFETLKTVACKLHRAMERAVDLLTCHHALYAAMFCAYLGQMYHLLDKDAFTQIAAAIYLAFATRG